AVVVSEARVPAEPHPLLHPLQNLPHPVRDYWQNHPPCGCWADFDGFTCGSLRSEYAFIFGSCRTWYREPCMKGPPPPAYPGEIPRKVIAPNCPGCNKP